MLLETYRECLRDVFDLEGLVELLGAIADKSVRVAVLDSRTPSPFAASLLFSYVASFIYEGDAPLAERRAQALTVDQGQLLRLIGSGELGELIDRDVLETAGRIASRLDGTIPIRHADAVHDLLLMFGDLTPDEIGARGASSDSVERWLRELGAAGRIIEVSIAGERRWIAAEDAGRYRAALGIALPPGIPAPFLEAPPNPLTDLVSRYARTHGPFAVRDAAARFDAPLDGIEGALKVLAARGTVVETRMSMTADGFGSPSAREGRASPDQGPARLAEWCDAELLRAIKRRSLEKLRRQIEPVEPAVLARFALEWHGISAGSAKGPAGPAGPEAVLRALEKLQGAPIVASALERELLAARVRGYRAGDLDLLFAAGEIVWRGLESLGADDGRIAIYLSDQYPLLAPPVEARDTGALSAQIRGLLEERGALFFSDIARMTGAFPQDLLHALWALVWSGQVTNDTIAPLRALSRGKTIRDRQRLANQSRGFRTRRAGPPGSEGRWSLLPPVREDAAPRMVALANALLDRHGILVREAAQAEGIAGGFSAVYPVLKAMEEAGKVRRGYFVSGLGATQFARKGADDRLRAERAKEDAPSTVVLSATDPANPYGAQLPWPDREEGARPQRAAGAHVVLYGGELIAWAGRTERNLLTFLPEREPERSLVGRAVAEALAGLVREGRRRAVLVDRVDGVEAQDSALAPHLLAAGFVRGSRGWLKR
jgi:ATP-dependent Lhr-like helicase